MNKTKEVQPYVLPELTIILADHFRNGIDSAYGMNIPVLVEFDYFAGSLEDDEAPQIYNMTVMSADGSVLQGERCTLTLWQGCDVTNYLRGDQESAIEEEMLARMAAYVADENDAALEHEASQRLDEQRAESWIKF